jgi:hypothetical protein
MPCFLDTMLFGKLLTAVDRGKLPPEVLGEALLSPITALESAQHRGKLRIMRDHSSYLRPLRSRFVRNPETFEDFKAFLSTKSAEHFRGELDALHAQCVMHAPFLAFHLSRYGNNPPKGIVGSQRFTSDVRDSMQLIISQEIPFITGDADLRKKSSGMLRCQVIHSDSDLNCVLATIRFVSLGLLTADKVG